MPLGQNATVADILAKLDGFYANVSSSETLIQSFYSDYQKEAESVVSFASRIEQTLSRAVRSGHIDGIAKDAMLRSKFWTGLKSQSLKTQQGIFTIPLKTSRHFYVKYVKLIRKKIVLNKLKNQLPSSNNVIRLLLSQKIIQMYY